MIRVLIVPGELLNPGSPPLLPDTARLAGLTLAQRAALLGWRCGAADAWLFSPDPDGHRRWERSESRLSVRVLDPNGQLPDVGNAARILILSPQYLPDAEELRAFVRAAPPDAPRGLLDGETRRVGALLIPAEGLAGKAENILSLTAAAAEEAQARCTVLHFGRVQRLADERELQAADRELYRDLTSVTDGWVDRVFNRRISGWFTRRIIDLPITPNQVTLFHFGLGLGAVALFWSGAYRQQVLGAILFQLSVALDCSDGEVARLKFQHSRLGGWLDVWCDNIVTIALFIAIARASVQQLGLETAATLGVLAVTGVLCCLGSIFGLGRIAARSAARRRSLAATSRLSAEVEAEAVRGAGLVDTVINEATSRDFSVIVVLFALAGRLEWFAWLAGIGSHLFWVSFTLVQLHLFRRAHAQGG